MLKEYMPEDFDVGTSTSTQSISQELKGLQDVNGRVLHRAVTQKVEEEKLLKLETGEVEEKYPNSKHRFIPGTPFVLGPKRPYSWDMFLVTTAFYITLLFVTSSIGFWQFETDMHGFIRSLICWILSSMTAFVLTGITEPGIVPPASPEGFQEKVSKLTDEDKERLRACEECNIIVEISTRHCPWCNTCCRELSHHCGVSGTCIGARNKAHFVGLQMFSGWGVFYLTVAGIIWLSMFVVTEEDTWERFVYFQSILTNVMQVHLVLFWFLYVAIIFGWWDAKCGPFPNPFYYCCFKYLAKPSPKKGYNLWKSKLNREPVCSRSKIFTLPERRFYPHHQSWSCFD
mmetsp:Transcript_4858/g.5982  ORF Transcript_4858/g.5982 Transcript_4858/m.5982 type:complete len:343 (+) Transcript_4858:132-1160(+)